MYKKTKSPLDGVVRHNTLRMLFILFTLFSFHSSLLAENISSKEDNATARADKYNSMGVTYYKEGKYDKALESFEKSLKIRLATIGKNNPSTAISYNNIGMAWKSKGEYDKAIEFYNKALNIYLVTLEKNHLFIAISYEDIALVWENKGEYNKAIEFYDKALKVNIERKDLFHIEANYRDIALACSYQKKYKKAIVFYSKSLEIWKYKDLKRVKNHNNNEFEKEYNDAIVFYNKLLEEISMEMRELYPRIAIQPNDLAYAFNGLGSFFRKKREYSKAIKHYSRALLLHKIAQIDSKYSDEVFTDIENIIKTHQENNNPKKAKEIYSKALDYYKGLFKKDKKVYGLDYVRIIIKGVEDFDLDKDELEKAKTILATLPQNSLTKGLLLQIEELEGSVSLYILAFMILSLVGLILYFKRYKNPTVQTFRANPKALLNATPTLLLEAKEKLERIKDWKSTLQSANISQAKAKKVLQFYEAPTKNMELFKELIEAEHCQAEGAFYRLTLAYDFKLKVDNLLVLFASDDADETFKKVKTQNEIVWVLVTEQSEKKLLKLAKEKSNNMVATSQENLTRLLLGRESQEVLAEIFAKNLSFKLLSPYPTDSGVPKESSFFGRTEIIREVLSQNNNNYLIVGARQLGKTAILQALERRYADDENAECFYVTFQSQSNVPKALATVLKMQNPDNVSLDDLVEYLSLRKRKAVFLLDEMDKVIKEDKEENDYLLTSTFRKLSQEGHASFVLTGFSTLYFSVTLEQESPLLNFGKLIVLDGLEKEACRELMTEPMKSMGITYENDDIIEKLIVRCGRRANLLAITCSEIIQTLDEKQKVISQSIVDAVVQRTGLDAYKLSTWGRISTDVNLNVLDRLIVYMSIEQESFELEEIVNALEAIKPTIKIENINQSLKRLVLGYVLVESNGTYRQRIPLLKEKLMNGLEVQKRGEIKELLKSLV